MEQITLKRKRCKGVLVPLLSLGAICIFIALILIMGATRTASQIKHKIKYCWCCFRSLPLPPLVQLCLMSPLIFKRVGWCNFVLEKSDLVWTPVELDIVNKCLYSELCVQQVRRVQGEKDIDVHTEKRLFQVVLHA